MTGSESSYSPSWAFSLPFWFGETAWDYCHVLKYEMGLLVVLQKAEITVWRKCQKMNGWKTVRVKYGPLVCTENLFPAVHFTTNNGMIVKFKRPIFSAQSAPTELPLPSDSGFKNFLLALTYGQIQNKKNLQRLCFIWIKQNRCMMINKVFWRTMFWIHHVGDAECAAHLLLVEKKIS